MCVSECLCVSIDEDNFGSATVTRLVANAHQTSSDEGGKRLD